MSSHKYNKQEWQTYKNNDEHKYVCDDPEFAPVKTGDMSSIESRHSLD